MDAFKSDTNILDNRSYLITLAVPFSLYSRVSL